MKKVFKFGCLGIIILIVLGIIIASLGNDDSTNETNDTTPTEEETTNPPAEESEDNEATDSEPAETEDTDGSLTKEKFDQIKEGMTYEEVVAIIGSEGTVLSESGTPGDAYHTVIYEFETDGFMSSANMTFQGGKLMNKAQYGLGSSDIEITLEQFNQLKNGMTTEEVFEILGGEGDITSESGDTVMYSYNGTSIGGNASLMFQGGKLMNKSQFGLE